MKLFGCAEAYLKFAKASKWQYQIAEIEEDLITKVLDEFFAEWNGER